MDTPCSKFIQSD